MRSRQASIDAYLRAHSVRKVQIGAGDNELDGWLNTDLWPRTEAVIYVDMTQPLPFPDGSIHYLYAEHVIEHITHPQALGFLKECRRTLAPAGRIRLATPNLRNLTGLFSETPNPESQRYVDWAVEYNGLPRLQDARCFVMNNFVRAWGHQFIYDQETLMATLHATGFSDPRVQPPSQSDHPDLRNLERHGATIGEEFNRFETMVIEANVPE